MSESQSVGQTAEAVLEKVRGNFAAAIRSESADRGEAVIVVEPDQWMSFAKWLAAEGGFAFLSDLCAVDWPGREDRFEIVYNLTDIDNPARLRIKLQVSGEDPKVPSVTSIWPTANWHEREAYDMFGIVFDGHPDLRRILMPDEWEGHPLRKDYAMGKVPVEYKSLSPGF